MSHTLTFGKHEGETYEWIFFKAPSYAKFIYDNGIHRQRHNFDEDDGRYFRELYRRASNLGGFCSRCKTEPVARMTLINHHKTNYLAGVGLYCGKCKYLGGSCTTDLRASFFVNAYSLTRKEQETVVKEIRNHYLPRGNLTQAKMEAFFRDDTNFSHFTPDFFAVEVEA